MPDNDIAEYRPDDEAGPLLDLIVADEAADLEEDARRLVDRARRLNERTDKRYGGVPVVGLVYRDEASRLSRSERAEALHALGLSQRAIAKQLGVSAGTVNADLAPFRPERPDSVDAQDDDPAAFSPEQPDPDDALLPGEPEAPTPLHVVDPDQPTLREAAKGTGIDPGEKGLVRLIHDIIDDLTELELSHAGDPTPGKVGAMRKLFDEVDVLRGEWAPHLVSAPREVRG